MKSAHLVYPHQLFKNDLLPKGITTVFVIEDPLYFGSDKKYPVMFHKQKLMLHRASMRCYTKEVLLPAGYDVHYIEYKDMVNSGDIVQKLKGFDQATVYDVVDDILLKRLQAATKTAPKVPVLQVLDTPNFYLKRHEVAGYFGTSTKSQFASFYQWQRKKWNILIDDNKPVGGKWSFDAENRKRLPKDHTLPTFKLYGSNEYVEEARHYVQKNFPNNPGLDTEFCWATSHAEAEAWLEEFLEQRFDEFGPYEDAIDGQAPWVYHSALTPALNIGLLNPKQIISAALARNEKSPVPLESLEGFIRQVLGWREYVRGMYQTRGVRMRNGNVFEHKRRLTSDWYEGTTGLLPLDDVIRKVQASGYIHHIERLMIAGNVMFISQIDPNEVYRWFMEMSIDAYDWVMVPNVYGMSQFADGGSMMTKPYMSGSNYVLKMSWYKKDDWCDIWDGLYWGFIETHKASLVRNPRMKIMVSLLDRMNQDRKRIISDRATEFINKKTISAPLKQAEPTA
jgi:deoxyribodipyrimidine photolyase-related protein